MKDSMEYKINDFKLIVDGEEVEGEELVVTMTNTWEEGEKPVLDIIVNIKTKNKK